VFLLSLQIQNFQVLREVHLTFGRGLNVLFGPNDLGKSTLAEALRVAFLLPVTSGACQKLIPWGTDALPRVIVKFEINDTVWQITKTFGSGARGTSLLQRVAEGGGLSVEGSGRAVEERLRQILAWGVPGPGGRGAPKGLPESYLSTALLSRQDQVTAILAASPQEDGVNSGLKLITNALGALGQDPLVSRLLQWLEERTKEVYTPTGQLKKTPDSRLVQLTNKVKEKDGRLKELDESVLRSADIEGRVQSLSERSNTVIEKCSFLESRVEVLTKVRKAEEELERVRTYERSVEDGRRALAEAEEDLRTRESACQEAALALGKLEEELRAARERLAKISGGRDKIRENAQQTRDARRAELVANRDAAAGRARAAREIIQVREQVQVCERELARAAENLQRAQQLELRAQNHAELASLLAAKQQANTLVEAAGVARKERDDRATHVTEVESELKNAEAALENATVAAKSATEALATAQWETAQRDLRKETLRASLIRAETAEREALHAAARADAARACAARLVAAEQSLAALEGEVRDIESRLSVNAGEKQRREAVLVVSTPLPIRAASLVGVLGGAIAAVLGILLKFPGGVLAGLILGSSLLAAGVAALLLRHRARRGAIQLLHREIDDLRTTREALLERRNEVLAKYGVAQVRMDSVRSERDQAVAMVTELDVDRPTAGLRLQQARGELECIRKELATLKGYQSRHDIISCTYVESSDGVVDRLKEEISEKRRMSDEARHRCSEAQVRFEAAAASSLSVDLAGLEQRVAIARMKAPGEAAPDSEEAQARLQLARQTAAKLDLATKVMEGRLSDARSRFEEMAGALGQPADQALAEVEMKRDGAEQALRGLEGTASSEAAEAENEFLEAQADVEHLGTAQTTARTKAEAATLVRDQGRTIREQARARLEVLIPSVPNMNLTDAEETFAQALRGLESDRDGSVSWPDDLAAVEALLEQQQAELRTTENALQEARGELKVVSGAVARDQYDQEKQSLDVLKKSAEDYELEYKATKRLLDVLREEEAKHAAHLGRSLARPVTEIFSEFTSGRYAQVVLDSGLRFRSVTANGGERDQMSLSVGTRDQLATLIRLALAAHLSSVIVLDDQLAHSDPQSLGWFRDRLRASVRNHNHQIIVITCRPLDYLHAEEMPVPPCDRLESADGNLAVVNLERLTSRS
jgi:DNA repair exonuclease SbcCD ATPase subunit